MQVRMRNCLPSYFIDRCKYFRYIKNMIIHQISLSKAYPSNLYLGVSKPTRQPTHPANPTNPIQEPANPMPVMGWRRVTAPETQDRRVGWWVWSWKTEKTNPTVLSSEKVVVFCRWERFAGGFSSISLEMAWYLWDPTRSRWDLARSRQDLARSHRNPARS